MTLTPIRRAGALRDGETYIAQCSAKGGEPMPSISWQNSFGQTYYYQKNDAVRFGGF